MCMGRLDFRVILLLLYMYGLNTCMMWVGGTMSRQIPATPKSFSLRASVVNVHMNNMDSYQCNKLLETHHLFLAKI